ncbi:MAG: hypothetical protein ACRC10_02285 [Thermoguttaceae bacterium]
MILPIGVNRVTSPLLLDRSLLAIQNQQSLIAKYEQQLTTEQRYQYGSESPYEASISVSLQMKMELKFQNATNLQSTQTYLTASDSTLSQISSMLDEARSMGLEGLNTTTGNTQRSALAQSISEKIKTIFDFGNYSFLNRYLFSGATTDVKPFLWGNDAYTVNYTGSTLNLFSWTDTDLLSQTNMNGAVVFGAISKPVKGTVDLNPALTGSTLLSNLNNGTGIQAGSIRITYSGPDGTRESDIDLSNAVTINDVRNAIAKNAPSGTTIKLGIIDNALSVELSSNTPGGSITITEIGSSMTAHQLGIYSKTPISTGSTFLGSDLDPALTRATSLDSLLGSPATTTLRFPGYDNDIIVQAKMNGESYVDSDGKVQSLNGVKIAFQSNAKITPGSERAEFDANSNTIFVHINPDNSTASHIVSAINKASEEGVIPPFSASIDSLDQSVIGTAPTGLGLVTLLPGNPVVFGETAYGTGESFDRQSGLQIINGNQTMIIDFSNAKTIDDLLNTLNDPKYGLYAEINASKTGINVCTRVSGTDFMIGENGGQTATQLGIRTLDEKTFLNELDFNRGVMDYVGPGTNASAVYQGQIANSGLRLTALAEGTDWNEYQVNYVPTTDPDGRVMIQWSREEKTITIGINPGVTKACEVVAAFNEQPGPNQAFSMVLDDSLGINTGDGVVYEGMVVTSGGTDGGIDFTITRNDGVALDIDINGAKTVGDVLALINNHPLNKDGLLTATLSKNGNGIELIDHSIGPYTTKVERAKLSTAAIDLGLIPRGSEVQYSNSGGVRASVRVDSQTDHSALNVSGRQNGSYANGVRIEFIDMNTPGGTGQPSFTWDAQSGILRFEIDPGVTTANDITKLFQDSATPAVREMFDFQNGVNSDGSFSDGTGLVALFPRFVDPMNLDSGVIEAPRLQGGVDNALVGTDPNPKETESIFNGLIRLQLALELNDEREIERSINLLASASQVLDNSRSEIGVRQNGLDSVQFHLENEIVQLRTSLSNSLEINLSDVILQYTAALSSYQATLQITGQMRQMSLLNYI